MGQTYLVSLDFAHTYLVSSWNDTTPTKEQTERAGARSADLPPTHPNRRRSTHCVSPGQERLQRKLRGLQRFGGCRNSHAIGVVGRKWKKDLLFYCSTSNVKNMITELNPELLEYTETHDVFGTIIRHPLVMWIGPVTDIDLINNLLDNKRKATEEALDKCEWSRFIYLHERPYRFDALHFVLNTFDEITDDEYWSLVSDVWIDTENAWQNVGSWTELFGSDRASQHSLMNEEELKLFASLDDTLTIYRGCRKDVNEEGLSWTLDRSRAQWFADRHGHDDRTLLTREISKSEVIAVFTRRGEEEVIVLPYY